MGEVSTIGLDLAKSVFQVHGADASGAVLFRKKLRRHQVLTFFAAQPPCTVAMEACGSCASLGARDRQAWSYGPADPAGLREALCQAPEERCGRCRGDLRSGPAPDHALRGAQERGGPSRSSRVPGPRSPGAAANPDHQCPAGPSGRVRHRGGQRPGSRSAPRAGCRGSEAEPIPELARPILQLLIETLHRLDEQIARLDREVAQRAKENETARRLMTIPGVGPVTAVALVALAPPAETFKCGRDFAAWVGLTPLQHSTGGKQKLGATSKMGERTLRRLLIIGASSVLLLGRSQRRSRRLVDRPACWRASRRCWCGWRWPTRWLASSGR